MPTPVESLDSDVPPPVDDPRFHPAEFSKRVTPAPRKTWRVVTTSGVDLLTQCEDFLIVLAKSHRVALAIVIED